MNIRSFTRPTAVQALEVTPDFGHPRFRPLGAANIPVFYSPDGVTQTRWPAGAACFVGLKGQAQPVRPGDFILVEDREMTTVVPRDEFLATHSEVGTAPVVDVPVTVEPEIVDAPAPDAPTKKPKVANKPPPV
jgi:hypothetical protein